MIKRKVFELYGGWTTVGDSSYYVRSYLYCVYAFGLLAYSVTLHNLREHEAIIITGKIPIKIDRK